MATQAVPSPKGGTVYEAWQKFDQPGGASTQSPADAVGEARRMPAAPSSGDVPVGDLGSGSDYSAFQQHLGVPSTDISSTGPYGVYHSVFDNFAWFKKFGDPDFVYAQQMARVFGLEALRMADADVLPYDYDEYGKEIAVYVDAARKRVESKFGARAPGQRYKFFSNRLDECYARNRWHFWRLLKGLRAKRSHASFDGW